MSSAFIWVPVEAFIFSNLFINGPETATKDEGNIWEIKNDPDRSQFELHNFLVYQKKGNYWIMGGGAG